MGFQRVKKGIFRRGCVGFVAAAMSVGLLGTFAEAATLRDVAVLDISEPRVSIIGNGVVDKTKKATGFYELSLCVQTTFVYEKGADGKADYHKEVTWAEYQEKLAAAEETDKANGTATEVAAVESLYVVEEHPFSYAAAAVRVDMDALTAVSWDEAKPTYAEWGDFDGDGNNEYKTNNSAYPRGIDKSTLEETFDVTAAELEELGRKQVRLDTAAPDEAVRAAAMVEDYDEDTNTALITLTANTSYYKAVNYTEPTPVVVIRFAYDTKRFPNTVKKDGTTTDFFVGLDKSGTDVTAGQTVLTYLTDSKKGHTSFDESAAKALQQVVRADTYTESGGEETSFYYYLGADPTPATTAGTVDVYDKDGKLIQNNVAVNIPDTAGRKILAKTVDDAGNVSYSYQTNLLTMETTMRQTLVIDYVNQETYRKNTGGKGVQILFYDWDDTLLGSLVVDETGDARAEVEAYVEQNMVHPDLRTDVAQFGDAKTSPTTSWDSSVTEYAALRDSLRREYSYRGKYAYEYGKDGDPAYVVDNGEHYPLTNKLDYVFYKRINGVTHGVLTDGSTGEETEKDYYSTMNLSQFEDAAAYPYVYGWALVQADPLVETDKAKADGTKVIDGKARQDAAALEDTWTSLGNGELKNVDPKHSAKNEPIPLGGTGGISGTLTADPIEYPAWLDPAELGTASDPWTPPTTYQFTTSEEEDNAYFKFADFSKMEDLVGEGDNERDTIVVKAVYERGEQLSAGFNYTQITAPSYNKTNYVNAESGGLYTVNLKYERVNTSVEGYTIGVARMRSPVGRQHSTLDLHWEETVGEDGERQTLTNATQNEADADFNKTIFTQLAIDNSEVIEIQMLVSGRYNKIDVYLTDIYGASISDGSDRGGGNSTRKDGTARSDKYIIDNYNYLVVGESDQTDALYDAKFDTKEGSHGFVLFGTLNKIMQEATAKNRGKSNSFEDATDYTNANDANLRLADGTEPDLFTDDADFNDKILAAAKEAETKHKGDSDYWNNDLDCAELTYHQLQLYIIEGKLYSRTDADKIPIKWCHYHTACAALTSNAPTNWEELIAAAKDPDKQKYILDMSPADATKVSGLRRYLSGSSYTDADISVFQKDLIDAVNALLADDPTADLSWSSVQNQILKTNSGYTDNKPERDFWWVDSSLSSKPQTKTWDALLDALDTWNSKVVTLPDGSTMTNLTAKLAPVESIVAKNYDADNEGEGTTSAYLNLTHNLVASMTDEGAPVKFKTYAEFETAVTAAYKATAGQKDDSDYWYILQKAILNDSETNMDTLKEKYYWKDGARRITDFESMLQNAAEDSDTWQDFTMQKYLALNLYFKNDFQGKTDVTDSADAFAAFKASTQAFAKKYAGTKDGTWEGLQYWLLHGGTYLTLGAIAEDTYYWWRADESGNQGTGEALTLGNFLINFVRAAFASAINGNTNAWGTDNEAIASYLNKMRLANVTFADGDPVDTSAVTATTWTDLTKFDASTVDDFKSKLEALVKLAVNANIAAGEKDAAHAVPTSLNWYEVQYYLSTGVYKADLGNGMSVDEQKALDEQMWWYKSENKPEEKEEDTVTKDVFEAYINAYFTDCDTFENDFDEDCFPTLWENGFNFNWEGDPIKEDDYDDVQLGLRLFMKDYDEDDGPITWYQIQYGINENEYASPEDAKAKFYDEYIDSYGDNRPDWLRIEEGEDPISLSAISIIEEEADPQVEAMRALMAGMDEAQKQMVLDYINQLLNPTKPAEEESSDPAEREETPNVVEPTPDDAVAPSEDAEENAAEDGPDRAEPMPSEGDSSSNVVETTPDEGDSSSNEGDSSSDTGGADSGGGDSTTNSADGNSANDWMNDHLNFVEEIEEVPTVATAATIEPRKSGRFTQRIETAEATVTEVTVAWPLCDFNRTAKHFRRTRR